MSDRSGPLRRSQVRAGARLCVFLGRRLSLRRASGAARSDLAGGRGARCQAFLPDFFAAPPSPRGEGPPAKSNRGGRGGRRRISKRAAAGRSRSGRSGKRRRAGRPEAACRGRKLLRRVVSSRCACDRWRHTEGRMVMLLDVVVFVVLWIVGVFVLAWLRDCGRRSR